MGLIDKIENKLSGSHKEEPSANTSNTNTKHSGEYGSGYGQDMGRTSNVTDSSTRSSSNPLQHPIGSASGGSGITGGTMKDGVPYASGGHEGGHGYGHGTGSSNIASTTDQLRDTHLGGSSQYEHNVPRQPYDPYSAKGQQIAANAADTRFAGADTRNAGTGPGVGYGASQNRAQAGDLGSRAAYSGFDSQNATDDVQRSPHGGVTNQVAGLKTGPHSQLENREAVPTAGGQKLGAGEGHHYGTDAGVAGAGGLGAYEAAKYQSHGGPASKTVGPHESNVANIMDPRVQPDRENLQHMDGKEYGGGSPSHQTTTTTQHHPTTTTSTTTGAPYGQNFSYKNRGTTEQDPKDHHYGRDAALAGGAGAGVLGAGAAAHHHQGTGQHGAEHGTLKRNTQPSTATGGGVGATPFNAGGPANQPTSGAARAKGMGGAYEAGYEAGYRDALEAVRSGQTH
ncbi:Hypothetical predicted protein [Lecanosticta acicola]|uniref:Uncharacterized protein n=1 Tax=Lecanosticta acicola TaxID=111012 RepID=A0AAI9EBD5_9PEZI|nr:Hypothetical predicted protein [Lecanosticta acicola]